MTAQTEVGVALNQHLAIDGSVRGVAGNATFSQRLMLEDELPGLFAVTGGTVFVQPCHREPTEWFHDVQPVWIVALDAIHLAFNDGVVLGQIELCVSLEMAFKTRGRVFAGVDDEFSAAR